MFDVNNIEVDFKDYYDMIGDTFHIQEDPDNPEFFCLIREREDTFLIVDHNKDKNTFQKRISNVTM